MRPERKASVMERLRSLARKTFSYPKLLMSTHPVTGISVIITTALFAAYTFAEAAADYQRDFGILLHIGIAAMFFTVFSLFLESVRPKWSIPSGIAVFALFALLSGFMSFINYDFNTGRSSNALANILSLWQDRLGTSSVMIYTAGIIAAAFLFAVYFSYTRCVHQEFNEHVINSVSCIFYTSIIYGVIQIGVVLLTAIVEILLFDGAFMYLGGILVIINGIFYAPALIVALIHENRPANAFFRALVRYVMLIISVIAYAIIYIYIIKLAVTRSVPSNSVFAILTALFVLTLPVSYMCTSFEDKGILQKFAFNTPVIFAPFIIMQLYTAIVRIGQYGLTPKRYFGIAFILFEVIYIVYYMYSYKRGHVIAGENILLIICSIVVISFVAPGINAVSLSGSAAKHTLASCLDKMSDGTATDSLYIRANAAYSFLSDNDYGKGRTVSYFPDLDNDTVESIRENARRASANKYRPKNTPDTSGNNLYCILQRRFFYAENFGNTVSFRTRCSRIERKSRRTNRLKRKTHFISFVRIVRGDNSRLKRKKL